MPRATVAPIIELQPEGDDAELVARARAGERWAEEALYRRHARHVFNVVARLLGSAADADDVVQDTFVSVLERLDQVRDPAAFRAWLMRTAIRNVYRRSRRGALLRRLGFGREPEQVLLAPADGASPEMRAQIAELEDLLGRLPRAQRVCWMLRHVEGYALDEVAEAAGCSLASAKRHIVRAHQAIRAHIDLEEPA